MVSRTREDERAYHYAKDDDAQQRYTASLHGILSPSFALLGFIGLVGHGINGWDEMGAGLLESCYWLVVSFTWMAWLRFVHNGRAWLH